MLITKKTIFKDAWKRARDAAKYFGGTPKQYFAECLKLNWSLVKAVSGKMIYKIVTRCFFRNPVDGWTMFFELTTNIVEGKAVNTAHIYKSDSDGLYHYIQTSPTLDNKQWEEWLKSEVEDAEKWQGKLTDTYSTIILVKSR